MCCLKRGPLLIGGRYLTRCHSKRRQWHLFCLKRQLWAAFPPVLANPPAAPTRVAGRHRAREAQNSVGLGSDCAESCKQRILGRRSISQPKIPSGGSPPTLVLFSLDPNPKYKCPAASFPKQMLQRSSNFTMLKLPYFVRAGRPNVTHFSQVAVLSHFAA
mmetsp:Transcript_101314/g.171505  ORF Transcript_101314/g.171505 Transcript_101314/m.171505 type:complete len:160 (+) Transcript_101314:610-1089(+)